MFNLEYGFPSHLEEKENVNSMQSIYVLSDYKNTTLHTYICIDRTCGLVFGQQIASLFVSIDIAPLLLEHYRIWDRISKHFLDRNCNAVFWIYLANQILDRIATRFTDINCKLGFCICIANLFPDRNWSAVFG